MAVDNAANPAQTCLLKHMQPVFIIEHLEPELWPWCLIEYQSISKAVGKKNVWFTNVQKKDAKKLAPYGNVYTQSIRHLPLDLTKACVLEPFAPTTLAPDEAKQFSYFIVGGILGDEKLNGRTKKELTQFLKGAHQRNIGKEQFSTDNAVYVTNEIIKGTPLNKQHFQDTLELHFNAIESVILPYRYPVVKGKPRISPALIRYLKNKETF